MQVGEVQVQHTENRVEQAARDLERVAANPHRGQRHDADQVVDTTLKLLFLGSKLVLGMKKVGLHGQPAVRETVPVRRVADTAPEGTPEAA